MFSLIITLVSIALVVALVAATIYYGGDAARQSSSKAAAAALVNQGSQIASAGALTVSQGSAWPTASPQFAQPFLTAMPIPPKGAYVEGTPTAADWTYYEAGVSNHFVVANKISKEVCLAVNKSQGFIGIPAAWDGKTIVQCYGRGVATLAGPLAYTFLFDPPGTTDVQKTVIADAIVVEANLGNPAVVAVKGYPRLCPDESTITTGLCVDTSPSGSGGGGGGGGGLGGYAGLNCTGTYSATSMSVSCVIANTFDNPMTVANIRGYIDYTYLSAAPTSCIGQLLAPGATCSFDLDAGFEGHPAAGGPAVFADVTYGADGTGGSTSAMVNSFTFAGGGAGAVPVGPPFVLDTFTGSGTLASHVGEVGATWTKEAAYFPYGGAGEVYTLDGVGGLQNETGNKSWFRPSGVPAAGSNYYIEIDLLHYIYGDWSEYLSLLTDTGYEIFIFLESEYETEVDGYAVEGYGDYAMLPPLTAGVIQTFRFEFLNGSINVLLNGVQYGTLLDAPKGQGGFYMNFPYQAHISRVQAGNLQ